MTMNEAVMKYLVDMKGLQVAVVYAWCVNILFGLVAVKQWKDFVSKKYFLRIKDDTFSCQKKRKLTSPPFLEMFKQISINNSRSMTLSIVYCLLDCACCATFLLLQGFTKI